MAEELTLQDVVNHMSNGFAQLNGRMDCFEGRMERIEADVKGIKGELRLINDRLTAIEEDLVASMEDIGVIKSEQKTQNRRLDRLETHVGIAV